MSEAPENIVQRQVDSYNAHDLDGFVKLFSPDAELYQLPDNKLLVSGRKALHDYYANNRFNLPNLHAEVIERMVLGKFVIYREHIVGLHGDKVLRTLAIYEIENDLIQRVWFIREEGAVNKE